MSSRDDRYSLQIARSASVALAETLPEKVALAACEFITGALLDNPYRVGKPLKEPLLHIFTARRSSYRIPYLIDEESRNVTVTAVVHECDAYRTRR
ncbi:type II toxin-antitoxin system RelE family toxin [Acidithrix ferrooxidans]|uniref:Toxin RelE n=1 Tax=Acidithrix ferrooxidans TaxID=1280514 RepID=A0A0D8HHC0_9ACTN|nr:plasmid stabilization protein [Acidithrix ferrooxidans]KJF17375.1 toxin RelE [Acidithrix ferrooxidans]